MKGFATFCAALVLLSVPGCALIDAVGGDGDGGGGGDGDGDGCGDTICTFRHEIGHGVPNARRIAAGPVQFGLPGLAIVPDGNGVVELQNNDGGFSFSGTSSNLTGQFEHITVADNDTLPGSAEFDHFFALSKPGANAFVAMRFPDGQRVDTTIAGNPFFLATGNLDFDGLPDLAVVAFDENEIALLMAGDGFEDARPHLFGIDGATPRGLAVSDLDLDGSDDIVLLEGPSDVLVFSQDPNDASAGFIVVSQFQDSAEARFIALIDIDNSGNKKVALGAQCFNECRNQDLVRLFDPRTGAFVFSVHNDNNAFSLEGMAVADFDRDGNQDLVLVGDGRGEQPDVKILLFGNEGPGGFPDGKVIDVDLTGRPADVTVGDFNGDLFPDIAVLIVEPSEINVLEIIPL